MKRGDADSDLEAQILCHLHDNPAMAVQKLSVIRCLEARRQLAILIAQRWARMDINTAWNAVARSTLSTAEKQLMFNELWG